MVSCYRQTVARRERVIVKLFVLLDLDWSARGTRYGRHVSHCKRYNVDTIRNRFSSNIAFLPDPYENTFFHRDRTSFCLLFPRDQPAAHARSLIINTIANQSSRPSYFTFIVSVISVHCFRINHSPLLPLNNKKTKRVFNNVERRSLRRTFYIFDTLIDFLAELFRSPGCKQHPRCPPIYHKQSAYFFRHVRSHKILYEVCRVRSNWNLKKEKMEKWEEHETSNFCEKFVKMIVLFFIFHFYYYYCIYLFFLHSLISVRNSF